MYVKSLGGSGRRRSPGNDGTTADGMTAAQRLGVIFLTYMDIYCDSHQNGCQHRQREELAVRSRYILYQSSAGFREYEATRISASAGILPTKRMLKFVSKVLSRLQRYGFAGKKPNKFEFFERSSEIIWWFQQLSLPLQHLS